MHRAISGDLQNEEEMDRAMEGGEEGIYQVNFNNYAAQSRRKVSLINSLHVCVH